MSKHKEEVIADLHSHSHFSDGRGTPLEMYRRAQKLKLDYFALTDHNTMAGVLDLLPQLTDRDLEQTNLVTGFELSLMSGHWLVLGLGVEQLAKQIDRWGLKEGTVAARIDEETALEMFQWVRDEGGLLIAAHPCIMTGIMSATAETVARLYDDGLIQGAEVHNHDLEKKTGPYYPYWHKSVDKLMGELGIPTYANSDAHKVDRVGLRHNRVKLDRGANFVEALRKKNVKVHTEKI